MITEKEKNRWWNSLSGQDSLFEKALSLLLLFLIILYRKLVSPFFPPTCRFYPTCSRYAIDAIRVHGLLKGLRLIIKRLIRCHPWNPGGYDPVPKEK